MLQSFVGTIDAQGLLSLSPEYEHDLWNASPQKSHTDRIWAVLDSADLSAVRNALQDGQKYRALQLLAEYARSLGPVCY